MYSIGFPDIFNGSTVNLKEDYEASKQNLKLLLGSNRGGLYGDPHYGTGIKTILWDQAHPYIVKELIREDIFESIYSYMPRINIDRDDIEVDIVDNVVTATINVSNDSSVENDLLKIDLMSADELTNSNDEVYI